MKHPTMQKLLKRLQQFRSDSPLSFRLLAYILLFSSVFTLLSSAIQVYSDFRKDVSNVNKRINDIETSYASSLARSLWALDQQLLQVQMEGILSLPDIVYLQLSISPDAEIVLGTPPLARSARTKQVPLALEVDGKNFELGQLTITASLDAVYADIKRKLVVILTTQFFKTFFISILILLIFRHLVSRHLTKMSNYAREFSLDNLDLPLALDRPVTEQNKNDELNQVKDAINQMRERLQQDVRKQQQSEIEIRKLSMAIEQSPSSVLICDRQWQIEFANQKYTQLTGFKKSDLIGKTPNTLPQGTSAQPENKQLWQAIKLQVQRVGVWQGEINSTRKNNEQFWEQVIITPIKNSDGTTTHYLILGEDISIRKRYEQQLLRQANYDILTGLPNRMLALDRLKLALADSHRESTMVGVLFLDLDNFKHINDTMGHDAGDNLLIEASRRISICLRGTSTVARLGGDEFLVVLPGLHEVEAASQVAQRILKTFIPAFRIGAQEVFVTTSIGIAMYPTDSDNSGTLLQHADAAMYEAKHQGKSSYVHFSPEMKEVSHERLLIESHLRRALELQEFELYYQPIVNTRSGKIVSAEALLRWKNPSMGLIMPDRFVPLAEETGLIIPIGEWVLEQACADAVSWEAATGLTLGIAVNVSPRQFRDPYFVDVVLNAAQKAGLDPTRLELEITERLILDNSIETSKILHRLDEHGIRLSIDDFGTGFSALSYLKSYPFDTLKIDKSFINEVTHKPGDASLVRAIVSMARSLELDVIAEGVENVEQSHFLMAESCDLSQGYFYSHPIPNVAFLQWLQTNQRAQPEK